MWCIGSVTKPTKSQSLSLAQAIKNPGVYNIDWTEKTSDDFDPGKIIVFNSKTILYMDDSGYVEPLIISKDWNKTKFVKSDETITLTISKGD